MTNCKNCNDLVDKNFCANCGEPIKLKRIGGHYILNEVQSLFNFEKGFFFTAKSLLIQPGKSVREFINENRRKYIKPVTFLIFTSVFLMIVTLSFDVEFNYFNVNKIRPLQGVINPNVISNWLQGNIGYTNLIIGSFIAIWIRLFFRKHGYNFFEIVTLLCFVIGEVMLIFGLCLILMILAKSAVIAVVMVFFFFFYIIWAIGQFFGEKRIVNYFKALFTYVLGVVSYVVTLVGIGFLYDFIN